MLVGDVAMLHKSVRGEGARGKWMITINHRQGEILVQHLRDNITQQKKGGNIKDPQRFKHVSVRKCESSIRGVTGKSESPSCRHCGSVQYTDLLSLGLSHCPVL